MKPEGMLPASKKKLSVEESDVSTDEFIYTLNGMALAQLIIICNYIS